jgi:glutamine---fructose-6-phosphate transaminase (isomerizing)
MPPRLHDLVDRLDRGEFDRIILTGMGSSYHALHPLHISLVHHGSTSIMVETSELLHDQARLLRPGRLLVAVSQSGASVEMIRLLEMIPPGLASVAVTNTSASPLAMHATVALCTQAGREQTVSCKTYLAALMALAWLSGILRREDLDSIRSDLRQSITAVSTYLQNWRKHVESLIPQFDGVHSMFLVGRGASLATAGVGGLIIKESAHFHAEGMSGAAFRHGPFEMLSESTLVAVFRGDNQTADLNLRLREDILKAGGRAALIGEGESDEALRLPEISARVRPILEMLPVEMMSFALAARAGREAGKFERASKVTTIE